MPDSPEHGRERQHDNGDDNAGDATAGVVVRQPPNGREEHDLGHERDQPRASAEPLSMTGAGARRNADPRSRALLRPRGSGRLTSAALTVRCAAYPDTRVRPGWRSATLRSRVTSAGDLLPERRCLEERLGGAVGGWGMNIDRG